MIRTAQGNRLGAAAAVRRPTRTPAPDLGNRPSPAVLGRPIVWSYGGGVQSVAIAVLIARGDLPRPALTVIADTGREPRATWAYLEDVVRDLLAPTVVEIAGHDLARVDLLDRRGRVIIPAFSSQGTAGGGRLPAFCSGEWKRDVIARHLKARGYGPRRPVRLWLGISVDELHRARPGRLGWIEHHFPLLFDQPMTRLEALAMIETAGLPRPPRSSCYMCPHRSNAEWAALPADEFAAAVALEREMRATDPELYLHRSRRPLDEVEFGDLPRPGLWDQEACDTGHCMT